MIDFMAPSGRGEPPILLMIHCNSRYLLAYMGDSQRADVVYEGLYKLYHLERTRWSHGPTLDTLISDAALVFTTAISTLCKENGIKQITYNMNTPDNSQSRTIHHHNRLGIIDRACRTLREMFFNAGVAGPVDDVTVAYLLRIYNNTPHETLSKTMGFDVTPAQAYYNRRLQDELVRRWMQENQMKIEHPIFTTVQPGTVIFLAAPRYSSLTVKWGSASRSTPIQSPYTVITTPYRVIERRGGAYVVEPLRPTTDAPPRMIVQRKDFVIAPKIYQRPANGSQDQGNHGYIQEEASESS